MSQLAASLWDILNEWWAKTLAVTAATAGAFALLARFWKGIRAVQPFIEAVPAIAGMPRKLDELASMLATVAMQTSLQGQTLATYLEGENVGQWVSNEQGMCLGINGTLCEWMGLYDEQAVNRGWETGIYEPDRKRIVAIWERCIKDRAPFQETYRYQNSRTGSITKCHVRAVWVQVTGTEKSMLIGMARKAQMEPDVLIVEDDAAFAEQVKNRVMEEGHKATVVNSYQDAVAAMCEQSRTAILLDLRLPDSTALETMNRLPSMIHAAKGAPIAILTGAITRQDIDEHQNASLVHLAGLKHDLVSRADFSAFFRRVIASQPPSQTS